MKSSIYILLIGLTLSCSTKTNKSTNTPSTSKTEILNVENSNTETELKEKKSPIISENAKVLSVKEELIMPSDNLIYAMTVKTEENDTLVFLDMYGFEKLIGKEINIEYKLTKNSKLLLCYDCTEFNKKPELFDISALVSDINFEELKLVKYEEDKFIIPASTFKMINKKGEINTFYSNDNQMISDSLKMKSKFSMYAVTTKMRPELTNKRELEQLLDNPSNQE